MATTVNLPTGTDGGVPIYNPNGQWQTWALAEVYQGQVGSNMYIPKVNDYVVDYTTNDWYRVSAVDPVTYIPALVALTTAPNAVMTAGDLLQGVGPGTQADTFRVYLDESVIPFSLAVEARLWYPSDEVASIKIFTGSNFSDNNACISANYNQSGALISQAIQTVPKMVTFPDGSVGEVQTVPVCYTNVDVANGTPVTIVAYAVTGTVVSKRQLLIEKTSFIRLADTGTKYVTGIQLQSPFMSQANPTLIKFPVNVLLSGLNLMGIVNYSDGTQVLLPVDGTKFQIMGFDGFVSTIVGVEFDVILKYNLSSDEAVYGANSVNGGKFITSTYQAITINSDGAYTLKLYAFPVWINAISGYRLEWYLYDLDRSQYWDVTSLVSFSSSNPQFLPLAYGNLQNITADVQLNLVDPSFTNYIFTATVAITLLQPGTNASPWEVQFAPGQQPPFGPGNVAAVQELAANQYTINLASGYASQAAWLQAMYLNTLPLTDPAQEAALPTPNYFAIQLPDGSEIECPLSQWNATQTSTIALTNYATLFVTFFLRTSTNDLQLSVAGVPINITNMTN
jgi:hypothetical protein